VITANAKSRDIALDKGSEYGTRTALQVRLAVLASMLVLMMMLTAAMMLSISFLVVRQALPVTERLDSGIADCALHRCHA